ncbi:MAG: DUF2334 domain-containing protein [Victivallaceae bacterium]|nr:DUF2334 domain-containing protein [Victivallaceae bacterium]
MSDKKKIYFGMSVDDVALRDWSQAGNLQKLGEFFDAEKVPATLFTVPVDESTGQPFPVLDPAYPRLLGELGKQGHEIAQHGLRHNRFELGVPPAMILNLPHETENKRFAAENREALERDHSVANCRERLREGCGILEDILACAITGFRAPALQESPGMFTALAAENYRYDSSVCLQETGWDYIMGALAVPPRPITRARWRQLRAKAALPILPLTTDYTWFLTRDKFDAALKLARHDYLACVAAEIPFITVCHVDPVMAGDAGAGLLLLRELYALARADAAEHGYELEFATLNTIAENERVS